MQLPQDFITHTSALFGPERWQRFLRACEEPSPVSVRFNPFKPVSAFPFENAASIPWCKHAYWLGERPNFTLDPLFHAGVYYVQEAGSLFLDHVLRQCVHEPVSALDLCAAPGGKSTLMRAALPEGSFLVSNEPDRRRANILLENMLKQGHPDVAVTHNTANDFQKMDFVFDVILLDVPCSGEGLFRRDSTATNEWSSENVRGCRERQRNILLTIWPSLRDGGLLIYSTCTFNQFENEENVRWICESFGAEAISVDVPENWHITGSLLPGWNQPVYRFIPGITQSEGLFMAVLRKHDNFPCTAIHPTSLRARLNASKPLHVLSDGIPQPESKGKEKIPSAAQALSIATPADAYPRVELALEQAQKYLHRESLMLPAQTPRGFVCVTYRQHPLGFMKNLGDRANNLYPKNWAIRNL